jgi:hypothetical protein
VILRNYDLGVFSDMSLRTTLPAPEYPQVEITWKELRHLSVRVPENSRFKVSNIYSRFRVSLREIAERLIWNQLDFNLIFSITNLEDLCKFIIVKDFFAVEGNVQSIGVFYNTIFPAEKA